MKINQTGDLENLPPGQSMRRFIAGLSVVAVLIIGHVFYRNMGKTSEKSPADLVNPLMGTDSEYKLSNGNTYPAIALPWGMNFWTPQTRIWMTDGVIPTMIIRLWE